MMDWTDRHCRYFLRQVSPRALLYTEMITTGAILQGKRDYLLAYHPAELPLAIQLGGSDPAALAQCALIAQEDGYSEVNLNVGCPSDRVQQGKIGACLMAEPTLVAECVAAMRAKVQIPVTVKTRIGIDDLDSYEDLCHFITTVHQAGCQIFIIHARKAWLNGLSPKENREIPPLRYDVVQQIKQDFPHLKIILNGGISTVAAAVNHLQIFDGIMLGRAAYHNPYLLAQIEQAHHGDSCSVTSRNTIVQLMLEYVKTELSKGTRLNHITRHMLGLFHGEQGGKRWRRYLSEHAHQAQANEQTLLRALSFTQDLQLQQA